MKKSPYATNNGGQIKAPGGVRKDSHKATVVKGNDLRTKKSGK